MSYHLITNDLPQRNCLHSCADVHIAKAKPLQVELQAEEDSSMHLKLLPQSLHSRDMSLNRLLATSQEVAMHELSTNQDFHVC